jgi:hypothetical protein
VEHFGSGIVEWPRHTLEGEATSGYGFVKVSEVAGTG